MGGRYLNTTEPVVWVYDDWRDPLCGPKADIEKYLRHQHRYPGLAVTLSSQSFTLLIQGDNLVITYVFIRTQKVELTHTIANQPLMRHRRQFRPLGGAGGGKPDRYHIVISKLGQLQSHPNLDLGLSSDLERNVATALQIKADLAARLSEVV